MSTIVEAAALLRISRARIQLLSARGTPAEARRAREVEKADGALAKLQRPSFAPAPTGPRSWCGGGLLTVAGRQVCALGTHDE